MSQPRELTITLRPEVADLLDAKIASGEIESPSDFFNDLVLDSRVGDEEDAAYWDEINEKVEEAYRSIETHGTVDGTAYMDYMRQRIRDGETPSLEDFRKSQPS